MKKEFKRQLNKKESWIAIMLLSLFCVLIFGIWMSSGAWFGDRDETGVSIKIATVEIDGTTSESLKETVWVALRNQQILSDDVTFSISPKSSELYARIGVFVTTDYSTSAVAKDVIKFQNFVPTENEGYTWVRDGEWYYFCDQDGKPVPLSHKDSGKAFGFMTKDSFVMPNGLRPQHYASNDTVELEIRIESVQARNVEDENISVLAPYFSTKYPEDNFVVTFKDQNETTLKTVTSKYAGDVTPPTAANITGKIFESWNTLKDGTGADISGEEFNNISQNLTLYPRYKSDEVTVTVIQTANGEITPGTTTTTYGNTLNFDVKANGGYKISSILIGGQNVEIKDENEQIVAVENIVGDTTLTATYELKEYLISVMSTGEGVTTPNTNQSVRFGDDISFTFVANEGKYISSLKIDGIEKISGVTTKSYEYTFASVSADHSVDVIYETSIYSITTNVVAYSDGYNYGEISPTENTCAHGKSVNFIVSAYSGAKISSIKVNGVEKLVGNNLTKININVAPTADTLVEVAFQPLWKMTKIDSKFYITDYLGNDLNLVVPAKIYDAASGADVSVYGVRSLNYSPTSLTLSNGIEYIGGNGSMNIFSNAEIDIANITLPNSITIIDSYAFLGCSEIINFVVPSKLQKIGDYAFQNCSNILSYDMPKTLIQIGVGAFDGNSKMSQLTFNSVAAPTIADGNIFSGTTSDLKVRVPIGGKASYVSNLSNRSFAENTYMYGLTGTTPIAIYKDNIFRYIYYIDILNSSGGSSNPPTGRVEVYQTQTFSVTFTPDTGNRIEAIYVDSSDENLVVVAEGDSQIQTFTNIQSSHLIEAVYSKMYIRLDINGGTGNQPLVVYNDDKTQFKINDNIEPTKSGKEFYYYSTNPDDNEKGQNGTRYDLGLWYDLPSTTSSTTLYAIYLTPTSYTSTSEYVVVPKTVNAVAGSSSKNMFGSTSDSTLKYITLHRNTITIGSFALYGCKTLTGISHSDGVVAIGEFAMSNCVELVKYRFAPFTQSVGVYAFAYDAKLGSITNFENTSVSQISDCMFLECSSIYEITLPNTIIAVGDGAFSGCLKLASIDLSKTKTATIGAKGFAYCENLSTIQLPSTLTIIDEAAFIEDKNLRLVQNLEKTIVSTIGIRVFEGCSNLSSIKLPQTLSSLGESAFDGCSNLSSVSGFENTAVTTLEIRTFANCSSLLTLSLARGLTGIKREAMIGCSVLRNLDTLSTTKVAKIGDKAFKDTAGLTSISLPTSTFVAFGQNSFENSGIQKINNLKNCSKFKSFGASSFMNSSLKEIEFPNCSFTIEENAFKNCTSLTKVTFNSKTAPSAQETSFEGTTSALQVYIPNGSIDSYAPLSLGGLHNKGFSSGFDTTISDYTALEYIDFKGGQLINSGVNPTINTVTQISFKTSTDGKWLFGSRTSGGSTNTYAMHLYPASNSIWFQIATNSTPQQSYTYSGNKVTVKVDKNYLWVNGKQINSTAFSSSGFTASTLPLYFGGINANGSGTDRPFVGQIYDIKIWQGSTLVRDMVPCLKNADNSIGMYDKVEGKFYANAGTGSFGSGAATDSIVEEYQRVEYIEATGTQYIDTGYTPNQNSGVQARFSSSDYGNSKFFAFGGAGSGCTDRAFECYPWTDNGAQRMQISYGGNYVFTSSLTNGNTYYLDWNKNAFTFKNETKNVTESGTLPSATFTSPKTMCLFAINRTNGLTKSPTGKIYMLKVYDNGTLVRDFVPVVRSRDGVAGLYDMVEHKFYTNAGTGTFAVGSLISADKGMSNGATMHYIGKSQVVATCLENIFKRHIDITMSDATYYFQSNTTRTIEVNEELPAGVVVKYTWKKSSGETGSGNSFKNVGTYIVTATISGGYYATTTATATLTIVQPSLSGITFTDKSFVYDGTKKSIAISGKLIEGASVSYSIKGVNGESVDAGATNGTTQVGVYEVTATFSGTLEGNTLVAYLTIVKASYRVTLENKSVIFDGNDHTINSPTLPSGMSIASSTVSGKEYDKDHSLTKNVSATENGRIVSRSNAGNYTITVNFDGGRNYNDTSSSATLVITPSSISISFADTITKGWTYDGKTHTISATAPGDVTISYSYTGTLSGSDNKFRDAGTYNLTATLKDNPNYYNSSASVTFTIKKANLTTTLNNETFAYTGKPHTYKLTNGIVGKGEDGTYSATACSIVYSYTGKEFAENDTTTPNGGSVSVNGNTATNAGWYSTKLVITAPLSSNNIQNYNTLTITGSNNFKINKASGSFAVGEVWALSNTTFINKYTFDSNVQNEPKLTFSSSDTTKANSTTTGAVYVTTNVVDRTSSTSNSKVVIKATNANILPTSFIINLIPFRYDSSKSAIIQYTSSKGNDGDAVVFPAKLTPNKITNNTISAEKETLDVKMIDCYQTGWILKTNNPALSASVTYGVVDVSSGITSIGEDAFNSSKMTSITLPSTITSIADDAFYQSTVVKMTLNSTTISFGTNAFRSMNNLSVIQNNQALSAAFSLSRINSKVWRFSTKALNESNINLSSTTAVSELKAKGYYYAIADNSVSVEVANTATTWYSTLSAAFDYAKGKTATIYVWRNLSLSSSIVMETDLTNIKLTAQYNCQITRSAANFDFFHVGSGSKFNLASGIILDGAKDTYTTNTSTVVYAGLGQFVMSGGTIQNNRSNNGGAVYVKEKRSFTMEGGTIQNCIGTDSAGAIHMESGATFTMKDGTIDGCKAEKLDGGAIYVSTAAKVYLNGGVIKSCTANNSGGGLFINPDAQVYLSGGTIKDCKASELYGGAVYNNGTFTMNKSTSSILGRRLFGDQNVALKGGAIYNDGDGILELSSGTIEGWAKSDGFGGGIYSSGTATISGDVSITATSFGDGGGIYVERGTITMSGGTIKNCAANGNGGGIYVSGGTFAFNGGKIDSCSANYGGGVYLGNGIFYLRGTIDSCTADYGGGVATTGSAKFNMTSGTISNNSASKNGGGIWCNTGATSWSDSHKAADAFITGGIIGGGIDEYGDKINSNTAQNGAGIFVTSGKSISIYNGTISSNIADNNGGGLYAEQNSEVFFGNEGNQAPIFKWNEATGSGGGLYLYKTRKFYMWNHTQITNNYAGANGGGIYADVAAYDKNEYRYEFYIASSSTSNGNYWASISYNEAVGKGGGIYYTSTSESYVEVSPYIENVAMWENTNGDGKSKAMYINGKNLQLGGLTDMDGSIQFAAYSQFFSSQVGKPSIAGDNRYCGWLGNYKYKVSGVRKAAFSYISNTIGKFMYNCLFGDASSSSSFLVNPIIVYQEGQSYGFQYVLSFNEQYYGLKSSYSANYFNNTKTSWTTFFPGCSYYQNGEWLISTRS